MAHVAPLPQTARAARMAPEARVAQTADTAHRAHADHRARTAPTAHTAHGARVATVVRAAPAAHGACNSSGLGVFSDRSPPLKCVPNILAYVGKVSFSLANSHLFLLPKPTRQLNARRIEIVEALWVLPFCTIFRVI